MIPRAPAVVTAIVGAVLCASPVARAQDYCATCHVDRPETFLSEPVEQQANSAHGRAEVSCADCHGGARERPTVRAHDTERGFVARPDKADIPGLCGSCHSDATKLGEFAEALPTDQLELYRRSGHGKALARGNILAATCVDCHGAHTVAAASEQESLTHPENVAPTCGGCHSDPNAMTASGMPLNQLRRWRRSVHGRRFLTSEDTNVPTCNGCHDAHGGITGIDDVAACGRCHEDQQRSFERSPHASVFERLGFASCVDCHGSHDVREARASLIGTMRDSICRQCHNEDQPVVFETIRRFGELRAAAALAERRGRAALDRLQVDRPGDPRVRELMEALEQAAADIDDGMHSFDDAVVEHAVTQLTAAATEAVDLDRRTSSEPEPQSWFIYALAVLAVLATVGAALLVWRRK